MAACGSSMNGRPVRLICQKSTATLDLGVMSHTTPRVVLLDFSGSRFGLPRCTNVGATPIQSEAATPAAQRTWSSITAPPKAAIEVGLFSVEEGARKP